MGAVVLLWVIGGVLSLFGTLTMAELAAMFPHSGGMYVYIREAFGPLPAFLFGWVRLLVVLPAVLGGIAIIFASYAEAFLPLTDFQVRGLAILALFCVGLANYRSTTLGAAIQDLSTLAKVLALMGLSLAVFLLGDASGGAFGEMGERGAVDSLTPTSWTGFGVALIAVLWAYDGWAAATFISGDVRDPERSLPRALIGGSGVVVAVYLVLNGAFLFVLPVEAMAGSELVAADAASAILGAVGTSVVAGLAMLAVFGALNGTMMAGPRVFFALGQDGLFFRWLGAIHPKWKTPHLAILISTVLGIGYVSVRTFEELAEAFILGMWPFYMLAILAVFRFRRTRPDAPRAYRTWGYPVVPALFLAVSVAMLLNALLAHPLSTLFSFGILASGVPVFLVWGRKAGGF
jgi:APA family basic amino acid/polyamine antiporter